MERSTVQSCLAAPFISQCAAWISILAARNARVLLLSFAPSCEEGAGKTGCRLAPMNRCAQNLHTQMRRRETGGPETTRPSLRDGLTAYACSPRSRVRSGLRHLANWRRSETRLSPKPSPRGLTVATTVRTTWFCRTQLVLLRPEASPDVGAVR